MARLPAGRGVSRDRRHREPRAAGGDGPGTVFESDFIDQTGTRSERSPAWQGRVALVSPPSTAGDLRTGGGARPTPAQWSGGWGDEFSSPYVIACPGLGRTDCELLAGAGGYSVYGTGDRALLDRHAGWYVYAVEYRSARDRDPFIAATSPVGPGPTTLPAPSTMTALSAPAGPVAGAPEPEVITPTIVKAQSPAVVLRRRALRNGARVTVARVTCPSRCSVKLTVS